MKKLVLQYGLLKLMKFFSTFKVEGEEAYQKQHLLLIYTCLVTICLSPLLSLFDFWVYSQVCGVASLFALLVLLINRANLFNLSRWCFIIAVNITLLYTVAIHPDTGVAKYALLLGALVAVGMFSKREMFSLLGASSISVGLFLLLLITGVKFGGAFDRMGLLRSVSSYVNIFCTLVAVVVAVYYLISIYDQTVKRLKWYIEELEEKEREIMLQNEELLRVNAQLLHSQAELTKNQLFLNSVIDNLPLMLSVKDAETATYTRTNKAADEFLRTAAISSATLLQQDQDTGPVPVTEEEVFKNRNAVEFEEVYQLKDNKVILNTKKVPVYNVDGKPLYLLSLSEDITAKKEIEEQIKASLHEKNILLAEIHHRVKNNMTIISSLLMLQSGYTKSAELKSILKESCDRIKSMSLIHEKLYQSETLAFISFREYVKDLIRSIQSSYGAGNTYISFELDIEDVFLNIVTAMPCGLLLNEVITNAYKHAFIGRSAGCIKIRFSKTEELYSLSISDDGIGITPGQAPNETDSLGLTLINALCSQLGGKGDFVVHEGTTFSLDFKELKAAEKNFR